MAKKNPLVARLFRDLSKLGNDAFKTREYKHFLSMPLTRKRAAYYIFERSYFHLNRRSCWALVSARAPFDIKQHIWHHEEEELVGDKVRGVENHGVLGMKEGAVVGMKPSDFKKPPSDFVGAAIVRLREYGPMGTRGATLEYWHKHHRDLEILPARRAKPAAQTAKATTTR